MTEPLSFREAEETDLSAVLALYAQPDMDGETGLTEAEALVVFRRMKTYPDYKVYVAVLDSEIVGTYALAVMDNLAHRGARSGLIEDVVVSDQCQGQGIGRQMMRDALNHCRAAGCYKAALSSNLKRERAHRFYESLGFEKHGYSFYTDLK
jgi:GNAT superfamily N-acetyltransferase